MDLIPEKATRAQLIAIPTHFLNGDLLLHFGQVVLSALFFHQSRQGIKKRHEFGNEHVRVAAKQYLHH